MTRPVKTFNKLHRIVGSLDSVAAYSAKERKRIMAYYRKPYATVDGLLQEMYLTPAYWTEEEKEYISRMLGIPV